MTPDALDISQRWGQVGWWGQCWRGPDVKSWWLVTALSLRANEFVSLGPQVLIYKSRGSLSTFTISMGSGGTEGEVPQL